jgi:amino acid transporter
MAADQPKLRRVIGLKGLTLYGVGVTLGAGIYALIGEVAGAAGGLAPFGFLLAGVLAAFTGLSYAELGSRYPESAGEAAYVARGFNRNWATALAGWGVAISGTVSSAAILNSFVDYLHRLVPSVPGWAAILSVLLLVTLAAIWGVKESVWAAAAITLVEAAGLVLIIAVALPDAIAAPAPPMPEAPISGLFAASLLAFFAFIGFEDMANMAEETVEPQKTLPRAILITLCVSALIYLAVAWVSIRVVPPEVLAAEEGALAAVFEQATGLSGMGIAYIALFALVSGALVQILMASRVLYGLSRRNLAPSAFRLVDAQSRTPRIATVAVALAIAVLALAAPMGELAKATSGVTLMVFALVNAALLAIRMRLGDPPGGCFKAPLWAPVLGVTASLAVAAGWVLTSFF